MTRPRPAGAAGCRRARARRPGGRRPALVLITALALLSTACGSRRSYDELLAGEAGPPVTAPVAAGGVGPAAATGTAAAETGGEAPAEGAPSGATGEASTATAAASPAAPNAGPSQPSRAAATEGSGAPAASGPSCTGPKSPIVLGSVGTQSGVIGGIIAPATVAVQAWVASVNAKGGIHCHPVKYLVADDGGDPSRHQALVRQMVEQNKVVAFLHMNGVLTGQASTAYLSSRQIPVIGNEGGSSWFYENPTYFPATGSGDPLLESVLVVATETGRRAGKSHLGLVSCIEASLCSRANDLLPGLAGKYGSQIVYRSQATLVQPDYTATCRAAQDAGVEVMMVALDGNSVQRFARSCASIGFRPVYLVGGQSMIPQLPRDPNLNGLVGANATTPWMLADVPAVAQHRRVMATFAPGVTVGSATMQGWVSAKLFEAATADVADPTTSAAILDGLWRVKSNDLGGLTYPITFTKGQNVPRQFCTWPVEIRDGAYRSAGLDTRICG